jgi:hypothetical protein
VVYDAVLNRRADVGPKAVTVIEPGGSNGQEKVRKQENEEGRETADDNKALQARRQGVP